MTFFRDMEIKRLDVFFSNNFKHLQQLLWNNFYYFFLSSRLVLHLCNKVIKLSTYILSIFSWQKNKLF